MYAGRLILVLVLMISLGLRKQLWRGVDLLLAGPNGLGWGILRFMTLFTQFTCVAFCPLLRVAGEGLIPNCKVTSLDLPL